jgi:hypothetical protein
MKIRIFPPIPVRHFDWCAIDEDTYDMTGVDEEGQPYSNHPVGYGRSEAEAIADLKEQLDECAM